MDWEKVLERHEKELKHFSESMHEISTDLQLLLKDHKYLSNRVENINKNINEIIQSQKELSSNVQEFSEFMNRTISWRAWIDKNWPRLLTYTGIVLSILWAIMDFLYKLDPPK